MHVVQYRLSDQWGVGPMGPLGCRTNGVSDQWDHWGVGPMGCRTNGVSDKWGVGPVGCPPVDYA